eukprot:7758456-Pyramimonas_sp.AAC.1
MGAHGAGLKKEYHNRQMMLCGVSLHTFAEAIATAAGEKRKPDAEPAGRAPAASRPRTASDPGGALASS